MPKKATTTKDSKPKKATKNTAEYFYAAGKRKTSVARVRLYSGGKGDIVVNEKPATDYFTLLTNVGVLKSPLKLTGTNKKFDIQIKVIGGGVNSQAEACRHGIARALLEFDPELRSTLKKAGLLTRDSRIKERKKPGLKRARRAPQFSKR
ncbi:MAG: 30S ribosomal protein S9 [Candidatus Gracilibacteria bacterium]|nr:30S ribosomal protein S9 [Candidatus Peregrinibacteria bacterium]